jgi:tetratricopeptide (TPR) repeat protein
MAEGFDRLKKFLQEKGPKGMVLRMARYDDEIHQSTELMGHYAGLRTIFTNWRPPLDLKTRRPLGGLAGIEQHYRTLSERFGFKVSGERAINSFGYSLLGDKDTAGALAAFERNVKLYPGSANVYDSLADALEGAGKPNLALENARKAVEIGTQTKDTDLAAFQRHLDRLLNSAKTTAGAPSQKQ